jgi:hypothetical protein
MCFIVDNRVLKVHTIFFSHSVYILDETNIIKITRFPSLCYFKTLILDFVVFVACLFM